MFIGCRSRNQAGCSPTTTGSDQFVQFIFLFISRSVNVFVVHPVTCAGDGVDAASGYIRVHTRPRRHTVRIYPHPIGPSPGSGRERIIRVDGDSVAMAWPTAILSGACSHTFPRSTPTGCDTRVIGASVGVRVRRGVCAPGAPTCMCVVYRCALAPSDVDCVSRDDQWRELTTIRIATYRRLNGCTSKVSIAAPTARWR